MSFFDWIRGLFSGRHRELPESPRTARESENKSLSAPTTANKAPALERITARVNRNGDVNDPAVRRPLLTLSEFFEGNDDFGSIGCNLSPPPGPEKFHEVFRAIAARPDVADVRIQITMFDDPEGWPYSDTAWIITRAKPQDVALWFDEEMRPDDCSAGWTEGMSFERINVPNGMRPVACWWD